jgi:hypothetical protein
VSLVVITTSLHNFNVWKLRITNILKEHDLEQYVTTVVEEPTTNAGRAAFMKSQAKAKRIIFDSVKDSIMSTMTSLMSEHWVGQIFKGCTLPCGKKGLKAQRVKVAGKRYKPKNETSRCFAQGSPRKQ